MKALVGDVIQLDPADPKNEWGPMLCIVDDIRPTCVRAYWLVAESHGEPPGRAYTIAEHGQYEVIGRAQWRVAMPGEVPP